MNPSPFRNPLPPNDRCCRTEPGFSGIDCPDCPSQPRPLAERLAAAVNAGNGARAFEETARGMYDALANMGACLRDVGHVVIPAIAAQLEMAYRGGQQNPAPTISALPQNAFTNCVSIPNPDAACDRCPVCDWPLASTLKDGCVPGNCAYRPDPDSTEGRRIAERRRQLAAADMKNPPG